MLSSRYYGLTSDCRMVALEETVQAGLWNQPARADPRTVSSPLAASRFSVRELNPVSVEASAKENASGSMAGVEAEADRRRREALALVIGLPFCIGGQRVSLFTGNKVACQFLFASPFVAREARIRLPRMTPYA